MAEKEREAELASRLAALEERLAELEEREKAADERAARRRPESIESLVTAFMPAEARKHLRAARKEQLLAMRSVLDTWVERVDREPGERRRRRESIPLEET